MMIGGRYRKGLEGDMLRALRGIIITLIISGIILYAISILINNTQLGSCDIATKMFNLIPGVAGDDVTSACNAA